LQEEKLRKDIAHTFSYAADLDYVISEMNIVFKHPVAFMDTSYTPYSVFNATLHLQLRIPLFYFTTCFSHKGPSSGVLFAKTVVL
jgi:hypothetical protein